MSKRKYMLGYVMVSENIDHFERIPGIEIDNWIERPNKQ
jgi:hypothetical protein